MSQTAPGQSPLLSVALRDGTSFELWPDRVAAGAAAYPMVDVMWAGLVVDPAQPPLPNGMPAPAIGLRLRDGRMLAFTPADPANATRALDGIFAQRPDLRVGAPPSPAGGQQWASAPPPPYGYGYAPVRPPHPSGIPDSDRILAGLAHLCAFFGGLILSGVIWGVAHNSMPYAARQAKQAFFWQLVFTVLLLVLIVPAYIMFIFSIATAAAPYSGSPNPFPGLGFGLILAAWGIAGVLSIVHIVFAIIGSVQAFQGKPFHYPLFGRL
ncbi:MAG: hypothetical protein OJF49_001572 [Ktedonobacterales bacterium]|jgi:uncharacterized Tic20 family protein|nr:MAG: hypothetical protein OJF49_001572 [Ktedonobacterales bacterium]